MEYVVNTSGLVKYAGSLVALAICSACGGAGVAPSNAAFDGGYGGAMSFVNGRPVTAARPNLSVQPSYETILPERHGNAKTFEYIINDYGTYASIFDYPTSDHQIGKINDVGGQGCTNVLYGYGKKFFWIVSGASQITEYEVPKKPIQTLSDSVGSPSSCAMDTSGDLAVGILFGSGGGDVVIFPKASGSGTVISTPLIREYFDGYDNQGNLFADGYTGASQFELVELPKGSAKTEKITTSNTVGFPGSVQWDGTYVTVTDQKADAIYQYSISGTTATLKGTVQLSGAGDCAQTWIATGVVFCADAEKSGGEVFDYPAGGKPVAVFTGNFDLPLGTVAAEK
jgi:hypothetical protein